MRKQANTSIELLMRQFQEDLDVSAFEQIFSHFLAPALATAEQLLFDCALAEDAVQETFLRVVRKRKQYVSSRPFSGWFYAILHNVCTDMLRAQTRYRKSLQQAATRTDRPVAQPPAGPSACAELLRTLSQKERSVLTLRVVNDLPFCDIAAALGISEEAAKKRAQRGIRRLRHRMYARGKNHRLDGQEIYSLQNKDTSVGSSGEIHP